MRPQPRPTAPAATDELDARLTQTIQAEVHRLRAWSKQSPQPHTLSELEQAVLGTLRRLGPQLLAEVAASEAADASLSPPLRLRPADAADGPAAQTAADPDG